jgi:hypothetical protein
LNRKNKQTHEKFTIQKEFEKASNTRNCVLGHCTFHPIFTILLENHYNGLNKYSGLGCGWSCVATWPPTNHPTFYLLATHLVIYIYIYIYIYRHPLTIMVSTMIFFLGPNISTWWQNKTFKLWCRLPLFFHKNPSSPYLDNRFQHIAKI